MSDYACRAYEVVGTSGTLTLGSAGVSVFLDNVVVGTGVASGIVTIYEGNGTTSGAPNGSGRKIAEIDASATGFYDFDATCLGGIYVTVTGGASKVTVVAG